jgi:hypothetical protein
MCRLAAEQKAREQEAARVLAEQRAREARERAEREQEAARVLAEQK